MGTRSISKPGLLEPVVVVVVGGVHKHHCNCATIHMYLFLCHENKKNNKKKKVSPSVFRIPKAKLSPGRGLSHAFVRRTAAC